MIYFDSAATSFLKPDCVKEAVYQSFSELGNAGRGAHAPTLQASRLFYRTREQLAELFHISNPERFAFCLNATEGLNAAVSGLLQSGDHVITTRSEHNSVLRPLYKKEKEGVGLSFLPVDEKGVLCYEKLEELRRPETKAVVVTHASNVTGNVTDLERIASFCRRYGLLLIADCSQTVGSIDIDLSKSPIDVLCCSGHKGLLAPQGTGVIYAREGLSIPPFKAGGSGIHSFEHEHPGEMPTALEAGTQNGHGIAGLYASLQYIQQTGITEIHEREMQLAGQFYRGIRDIPGVRLYGDYAVWDTGAEEKTERTAVVSLNIGNEDAASISDWLWEDYGICTRAGAHCAPLIHEAMGTEEQGMVRFSFSHLNTEEEVETGIRSIREIAEQC
ncbi:MAG: aminotransferase class V-fold PLP-dependent enzyme [Lachnospiraceae bacterium]|nr:aminotransferase class V-fold PLP-dependent enzyme [Lachnospiraceae bacterium]